MDSNYLIDFFLVFGLSAVKFVLGPALGYGRGLPIFLTILAATFGMMSSVVMFTYFGQYLKKRFLIKWFKPKRTFTRSNRLKVRIWKKYGIWGTAFLTPIIFSPVIGTIVAVAFENRRLKIIYSMFVAATFWAVVLSFVIYYTMQQTM